jgi:hypothetical protein
MLFRGKIATRVLPLRSEAAKPNNVKKIGSAEQRAAPERVRERTIADRERAARRSSASASQWNWLTRAIGRGFTPPSLALEPVADRLRYRQLRLKFF